MGGKGGKSNLLEHSGIIVYSESSAAGTTFTEHLLPYNTASPPANVSGIVLATAARGPLRAG